MKFSSVEEYGLRCLIRIAKSGKEKEMTIPEIAKSEGMSIHNTAKILRLLRIAGYLESVRGHVGGYKLAKPSNKIIIKDVINSLGGNFYESDFCRNHAGELLNCINSTDCTLKLLWSNVQEAIDNVLGKITLANLINER